MRTVALQHRVTRYQLLGPVSEGGTDTSQRSVTPVREGSKAFSGEAFRHPTCRRAFRKRSASRDAQADRAYGTRTAPLQQDCLLTSGDVSWVRPTGLHRRPCFGAASSFLRVECLGLYRRMDLFLRLRGTCVFSGGGAGREVGDGCDEQGGFGHDRYQAQWLAPVADVVGDVWQAALL